MENAVKISGKILKILEEVTIAPDDKLVQNGSCIPLLNVRVMLVPTKDTLAPAPKPDELPCTDLVLQAANTSCVVRVRFPGVTGVPVGFLPEVDPKSTESFVLDDQGLLAYGRPPVDGPDGPSLPRWPVRECPDDEKHRRLFTSIDGFFDTKYDVKRSIPLLGAAIDQGVGQVFDVMRRLGCRTTCLRYAGKEHPIQFAEARGSVDSRWCDDFYVSAVAMACGHDEMDEAVEHSDVRHMDEVAETLRKYDPHKADEVVQKIAELVAVTGRKVVPDENT